MSAYFLDSSALVKRYVQEVGTSNILKLFTDPKQGDIFIATVTSVEIVAAITRRMKGGSLRPVDAEQLCKQLRTDLQTDYLQVEITEKVIQSAMQIAETYGLRGYDAIQLAAGCAVNDICIASNYPPLTFVSADHELNDAALQQGLIIDNPNDAELR